MRVPTRGKRLYSSLMFAVVSILGGLLVAGLIVPTAGMTAELTKASANAVESIPRELETPPPAEGSTVLLADGSELTKFYDENRTYVPLSEIAPIMQAAQIAVEDQRFYEHGALDLRGTMRALVRTSSGNTQGGSSLTQQYVKLALLDKAVSEDDKDAIAAAQTRTFARKLLELRYAIALEQKLSKDDILERYLNLSYYGDGAYGVEAAAQHYFSKSARDLNLPEAAMLAGLVRNPSTTDPVKHEKIALERRNNVLDVMGQQNLATPEEIEAAKATGFDRSLIKVTTHGCPASRYPHLCSVVEKTLLQMKSLGPDRETRRNLLNRGGLTIATEIDPRTQDAAQQAVSNYVYPTDPVIAVMVMVEPGTGLIKGIAQSRPEIGTNEGQTYYNYAMDASRGGAEGYFGGSTFKAFTLAAALEKGFPTSRSYNAPNSMDFNGQVFTSCDGKFRAKGWKNPVTTGTSGYYDMYEGAKKSSNTYFMQLERDTGLCEVTKMAEKLGLRLANGKSIPEEYDYVPAFTLGTAEITPISLANAYATFAARGVRCDPIILKSAVGKDGKVYEVPSANCQQVIPQNVADTMNDILQGPFDAGGTAASANIPGYEIAGKTGTDTNAPTIWTVGYTANLAGAAMITVDKKAARYSRMDPNRRSLEGAPVRGGKARLAGSSGREAGAGIWKPAMAGALQGLEKVGFTRPDKSANRQPDVEVPSCRAMGLEECRDLLQEAGFGTSISRVENSRPSGTFLGTSPRGTAPKYSTIRLLVSSGPAPRPEPVPEQPAEEGRPGRDGGDGGGEEPAPPAEGTGG